MIYEAEMPFQIPPWERLGTLFLRYPDSVSGALRELPKKWRQFGKFTDGLLTVFRPF